MTVLLMWFFHALRNDKLLTVCLYVPTFITYYTFGQDTFGTEILTFYKKLKKQHASCTLTNQTVHDVETVIQTSCIW